MIMADSLLYTPPRGYIHITSPNDVYAPPHFDAGYLSDPADVPSLVWAYKNTREIVKRLPPLWKKLLDGRCRRRIGCIHQKTMV